ncbi:type II toxin-antitoxin system VapC family toxin [Fortiea sp. LEGE XX443]|uniref:type II toxin-antitoxin system VapC family toxin n=1 Tax=Fortiea sp. LEGE XX443 TaxID=1828611 RepID=UPI00187F78B0|nr:type II toxin-antitoxin system VapC family toxin [Fortiea sp. LEGE XX443]MBE9008127.1 type II toxin-antitoxin system VapC family toxin [Fortiea sp. LEGE XX443]
MNYSYLLDTNMISDLIKNPRGLLFFKIQDIGEDKICTSIIVACESRFGARKKNSTKLTETLEIILSNTDLEKQGKPIGSNDLLIAAHALTLNLTVITANIREFSRVPSLKLENWLKST